MTGKDDGCDHKICCGSEIFLYYLALLKSYKADPMNKQLPILVVDYQRPMRQAITAALHDLGFTDVIQESSGLDAMRTLRSTSVAAVIADWTMPGMSGLGLLRWVRSEANYAKLPFILITAESDREKVRMATEAGVSEYLIKPYTVQDLANKIKRVLGGESQEAPQNALVGERVLGLANAVEVEQRIGGSTVLVVDDMPSNVEVIVEILKGEYHTVTADSGRQALDIAQSAQPPDLILLDVVMPEIDGYEVCRQLKANPATRDIPIIFLTCKDDVENVVHGLETGAVDYITKPAEPSILKARIRTHLRLKLAFGDLARQHASLVTSARLREDVERITQHDLKNPITAILSGTEFLLSEGSLTEADGEMVQLLQAEAWRVLDLVNQSLSLYRMETGAFVLQSAPLDLVSVLGKVRQETLAAFKWRNLDIRFAADEGEIAAGRYIALGETGLCHSLFGNLLRNAAEAAPEGSVIDVRFGAEPGAVTVMIHNEGAVPASIRDRFFDKYVTAGKAGGTGLGTYSAKLVTEAQKGTIAMHTDDVAGTTLTVRLQSQS